MNLDPTAITISALAIGLIFLNPRWAAYFYFTLSWCYPATLLYGTLPLGVRLSDVYVILLALACARIAPKDILQSWAVRLAILWFISITLGCIVGSLSLNLTGVVKNLRIVGRSLHIPLLTYIVFSVVQSRIEARRMIGAILIAASLASLIGVVQIHAPELTQPWEVPNLKLYARSAEEQADEMEEQDRRADVATGGVSLAVIGFSASFLSLRLLTRDPGMMAKVHYAAATALTFAGMWYTVTRGAILGYVVAMLYSITFFGRRLLTIALICVGVMAMVSQTDFMERLDRRIYGESGSADVLEESAETRFRIWTRMMTRISPHYFLFGRGMIAEYQRLRGTAHSSYVGAIVNTGLFGFIICTCLVVAVWRRGNRLIRSDSDPFMVAVGEGLLMVLIGLLVNGLTAEHFQNAMPLNILFAVFAVVEWRLKEQERNPAVLEETAWTQALAAYSPEAAADYARHNGSAGRPR